MNWLSGEKTIIENDAPLKRCTKCGRLLPVESFGRNRKSKDGRTSQCKECRAERYQANREKKAEYYRTHREERAEYNHRYYQAHREELVEQTRLYRQAYHEKVAEQRRCYYQTHREEVAENNRLYRQTHSDEIAEYRQAHRGEAAEYYRAHREERAEYNRTYYQTHREEVAEHWRNRRAREMNAKGAHTAADIRAQYERQHGRCYYCGEGVGVNYHVDHVVPLSKGGSNGPENLVIACPACNLSKSSKHPMEFAGMLF